MMQIQTKDESRLLNHHLKCTGFCPEGSTQLFYCVGSCPYRPICYVMVLRSPSIMKGLGILRHLLGG